MVIALALALSSCNNDDSPLAGNQTAIDSADTQITLYISMSNAATTRAGTRADDDTSTTTWGDDYNSADATTFEITISTLQVLFFNSDGSLAAVAEQTALWSYTSSSSSEVMYEYIGTVTPTDTGFTDASSNSSTTTNNDGTTTTSFTGTVMVLANCPTATTTAYTIDDSGNITYTTSSSTSTDSDDTTSTDDATTNAPILIEDLLYDNGTARTAASGSKLTDVECMAYLTYDYADVTETTGLPMWGMATTDALTGTTGGTLTFTSGYNTSLGNIDLLRALSKILVTFDDDTYADGFTLTSIAVNRYLDAGYCLPSGYITTASTTSSSPATVSETTDLDQEDCQNVYSDAGTVVGTSTISTTYTYTTTDDEGNTTTTTKTVTTTDSDSSDDATTTDDDSLTGQVTTVTTTYSYDTGTTDNSTVTTTPPDLLAIAADNGGYIVYLPEYDNADTSLSDDDHVTLTLAISRTVENDEDDTFNPYTGSMTLTLQEYASSTSTTTNNSSAASTASGDPYGLVRNHQYAFTLTQIDNSTLSVVTADDWDSSESTVSWDVDDAVVSFLAAEGYYSNFSAGDADAVYCLLNYPRWSNSAHTSLTLSTAYASYALTVTCDYGEITWAVYLDKNEDYFVFSTSQTTTDDLGLGTTNYRGSKNGVSRDTPYLIKLSCKYKWSELQEMAHPSATTDSDGNTTTPDPTLTPDSDGTIWMITDESGFDTSDEESETNNVDVIYYKSNADGSTTYYKLVALYTDLFILAKGAASNQVKPLPINPTVGTTLGNDSIVGTSKFTPNWFPGGGTNSITATVDGSTITLNDNQWVRIYQARASLSTTADGGNTYNSVCKFISNNSPQGEQYWKGDD